MTNNICDQNVGDCHNLVVNNVKNYGPPNCCYRLWGSVDPIKDKPNIVLVHGSVIPLRHTLHKIDRPNNFLYLTKLLPTKLCSFLQDDCKQHNIWSFEYADEDVAGLGYVNYKSLATYGERLRKAIQTVKSESQNDTVNIIAHSMGGLIARYAAQDSNGEKVNKIITLDTGHCGFGLAGIIDDLLKLNTLPEYPRKEVQCSIDAAPAPKSEFVQKLTDAFAHRNYELVSLAAGEGLGGLEIEILEKLLGIRSGSLKGIAIADWRSSSMGQVDDNGHPINVNHNIKFEIMKGVNHLTIALIMNKNNTVYERIINNLR
jgi:pimeloyl-ACP methyl ester carboxylesterase